MANGYGGSSGSSSSSRTTSSRRIVPTQAQRVVTQRPAPPPGFHYMPDGTLMSDAEHARLYGQQQQQPTTPIAEQTIAPAKSTQHDKKYYNP